MEDNRYEGWGDVFGETNQQASKKANQQEFKKEVKKWLREHKSEIISLCESRKQSPCKEKNLECKSCSPYGMLACLMGISISSINNWMSAKAQKLIPENRVEKIERIMREVAGLAGVDLEGDAEPLSGAGRGEFVQILKTRLSHESIGRFYMEAEKAGMSLDAYLQSLLR